MLAKLTTISMLALVFTAALLAGCQSQSASTPNALAGKSSDAYRYTDDKGHYHADLAIADRPLR